MQKTNLRVQILNIFPTLLVTGSQSYYGWVALKKRDHKRKKGGAQYDISQLQTADLKRQRRERWKTFFQSTDRRTASFTILSLVGHWSGHQVLITLLTRSSKLKCMGFTIKEEAVEIVIFWQKCGFVGKSRWWQFAVLVRMWILVCLFSQN